MQVNDQRQPPTRVAVLGSCATRDNFNRRFNPTYRENYECVLAQNQTSIISLMSQPVLDEWQPLGKMSDYDRWNVATDLTKSFLSDLAEVGPEYLIVDFFADIHFGVLRLSDGRFVTDNRWKIRKTDWYQDLASAGAFSRVTIFRDTEEYLALWQSAFDRLVSFVDEHTPHTKIVVHRGYNTNLLQLSDRPRPVKLRKHRPKLSKLNVPRSNELWRKLDDHAVERASAREIDLTDVRWTTYEDHPWGPFYVHFPPEYNHRFLAELHKIVLADSMPTGVLCRIHEIEVAREELHATEMTRTIRELDQVRDELAEARAHARGEQHRALARGAARQRTRRLARGLWRTVSRRGPTRSNRTQND